MYNLTECSFVTTRSGIIEIAAAATTTAVTSTLAEPITKLKE